MKKIIQSLLFPVKEERGVTKIIVVFSIVALLGFTALVVDAGGIYFEKSRLQKALDAAVLGGAQHLKITEEKAEETAISLGLKNGFTVSGDEVTTGEEFIEIEKTVNKELTFAKILGFNDADIHAVARAELVQALVKRNGVVPIGLEAGEFKKGQDYDMNFNPGGAAKGNFGWLGLDGGGSALEYGLLHGSKNEVAVDMKVDTETGLSWGNVKKAIEERIARDAKKPHCQSYVTADNECSRFIIVPLIDTFDDLKGGSGTVKIVGFAAFWIDSIKGQTIHGRFIDDYVTSGTFEPGEETNIYGVKLVK
ncbi:pilus assembly protein TadG-related protein [Sporosarcina sp. Marseille-Q4943]|uniref:pilus assembly protein TadG-related protein n=1 Tax=Sporosarcina sp. Marseille-Q4943 TaxID=2942204 RepID=UPI00208DCC29|nr:Tad domain-containing protein [Sporosarcina sp. Marseille-Q4943]